MHLLIRVRFKALHGLRQKSNIAIQVLRGAWAQGHFKKISSRVRRDGCAASRYYVRRFYTRGTLPHLRLKKLALLPGRTFWFPLGSNEELGILPRACRVCLRKGKAAQVVVLMTRQAG